MNERPTEGMNTMHMGMDEILQQLSSLKDNSESFSKEKDADPIWQADVTALEAAISILSALQDEGINDAEETRDIIEDYRRQAKQIERMHTKYEVKAWPIKKDSVYHCPECNHRVPPKHTYCHWCGKRLGGW